MGEKILLAFSLLLAVQVPVDAVLCDDASTRCAYRVGCGRALQDYFISCSALDSNTKYCPEDCLNSLIALTSTYEGKLLMTCECGDERCRKRKERVNICRPQVMKASLNDTIVSCNVAQYICGADPLCSTALRYYNDFCRTMFQGKKCSSRCENSINILRKQEKAAKLNSCICDGKEMYDCDTIRKNMDRLCFVNKKRVPVHEIETTKIPKLPEVILASAYRLSSSNTILLASVAIITRFLF